MSAVIGWALLGIGLLCLFVGAWRTISKLGTPKSDSADEKPSAPAEHEADFLRTTLSRLPPEATKRQKALKAMRSSSGLTVTDALRLIDRLQQDQVCELAIHALEACELYLKNPTDPALREATKEILFGHYAVGGDGGISSGTSLHRFQCDECGIVSPSGRNDALAREYAEDLGWLLSDERDLCPKHRPVDEPVVIAPSDPPVQA